MIHPSVPANTLKEFIAYAKANPGKVAAAQPAFDWKRFKGAMWLDGIGFAQPLEDPMKSRIVGKVGYGVMPPGPKQQVSAMFANGHGISSFSKNSSPPG